MTKTLQDLRREAGYKSAKDFAEAVGISESSYSRYEANPENINMKAAIKLADFLGCSLDMIMGREPVTIEDMRGDVQKFYDSLTPKSKELFDEFAGFIQLRDIEIREKARQEEVEKYLQIASSFEQRLYADASGIDRGDGKDFLRELLHADARGKRELFRWFVDDELATDRFDKAESARYKTFEALAEGELAEFFDGKWSKPIDNSDETRAAKAYMEERGQAAFDDIFNPREAEDKELLEHIMAAYDSLHPQPKEVINYAIIDLD